VVGKGPGFVGFPARSFRTCANSRSRRFTS
jgi:hypothetical protein